MNHLMDCRAKAFLRRKPPVPLPHIFMEPWTIYISGEKISGGIQHSVWDHCSASDLLTWWTTKQKPQASFFHQIDWEALCKAMTALRLTRRHWIAKHAAGICGVGKVLKRWKWQDHSTCPRCSAIEDAAHVWECRAPSSIQVWEESIARLDQWMESTKAYPPLRQAICSKLLQWKKGDPSTQPPVSSSPDLLTALSEQEIIGWRAFLEGRLSLHWATAQHQHFQSLSLDNTGHRWVSLLIRKLLDVAWDQWEHRCGQAHDREETAHAQQISTAVEDILRSGPGRLTGRDRRYFSFPARVRSLPTSKKAGWLANVDAAFRRLEQQDEDQRHSQRSERALMFAWLHGGSQQ